MLIAYLFDRKTGRPVDAWAEALNGLDDEEMLWVDVVGASAAERHEVREAFGLEALERPPDDSDVSSGLERLAGALHVRAIAISDDEKDESRERIPLDCFVGPNWVVTVHEADVAALDKFREAVQGGGEVGMLDAPSFLATQLEWVVTSYLRAFDEIEETLEEFDLSVLANPSNDTESNIKVLTDARRRVGGLRRTLAPHRELFASLSHAELELISSEGSASRFANLTANVDAALTAARDVKDGIASSFDVLILRTEHRTNEIIKTLTIASILLLPGALIAGVAGMNVNFGEHTFASSGLFWAVLGVIVGIAFLTLITARIRHWL